MTLDASFVHDTGDSATVCSPQAQCIETRLRAYNVNLVLFTSGRSELFSEPWSIFEALHVDFLQSLNYCVQQ